MFNKVRMNQPPASHMQLCAAEKWAATRKWQVTLGDVSIADFVTKLVQNYVVWRHIQDVVDRRVATSD